MESPLAALKIREPKKNLGWGFRGVISRIRPGKEFSVFVRPHAWLPTFDDLEAFLNSKYFTDDDGCVICPDEVKGENNVYCVLYWDGYGAVRGKFTGDWRIDEDSNEEEFCIDLIDCGVRVYYTLEDVYYLEEEEIAKMPPLAFQCQFTGFEGNCEDARLIELFLESFKDRSCEVEVTEKVTNFKGCGNITMLDSGANLKEAMIAFGFS